MSLLFRVCVVSAQSRCSTPHGSGRASRSSSVSGKTSAASAAIKMKSLDLGMAKEYEDDLQKDLQTRKQTLERKQQLLAKWQAQDSENVEAIETAQQEVDKAADQVQEKEVELQAVTQQSNCKQHQSVRVHFALTESTLRSLLVAMHLFVPTPLISAFLCNVCLSPLQELLALHSEVRQRQLQIVLLTASRIAIEQDITRCQNFMTTETNDKELAKLQSILDDLIKDKEKFSADAKRLMELQDTAAKKLEIYFPDAFKQVSCLRIRTGVGQPATGDAVGAATKANARVVPSVACSLFLSASTRCRSRTASPCCRTSWEIPLSWTRRRL